MLHIEKIDALHRYRNQLEIFREEICCIISALHSGRLDDSREGNDRCDSYDGTNLVRLRNWFETDLATALSRLDRFIVMVERARDADLSCATGAALGGLTAVQARSQAAAEAAVQNNSTSDLALPNTVESLGVFRGKEVLLVPLGLIALDDHPLEGAEAFGPGLRAKGGVTYEQMERSMRILQEQIMPGLRIGANRETFEDADQRAGRQSPDTLGNYFSVYLDGNDTIGLSRRADGRYDISSGRHRIQVACDMGYFAVPARLG